VGKPTPPREFASSRYEVISSSTAHMTLASRRAEQSWRPEQGEGEAEMIKLTMDKNVVFVIVPLRGNK